MSFFDFFKVNEYKKEIEGLKEDLSKIKNKQLSMEQMTVLELNEEILKQQKRLQSLENEIEKKTSEYKDIEKTFMKKQEEINTLKTKFLVLEDDLLMESYGLYVPKYDFATSMGYKEKLKNTRTDQKQMIKNKSAVSYYDNWTVNGSKAKGRKMTNDNIKQILRSFNNECEAAINKVKYNNIHSIEKRIIKSFEQLNKLNSSNRLSISEMYLDKVRIIV
ncbi:DUF4041 domain-containing protein [Vagococcus lutrae]|uniref:DUF4041 domain-containing protein n=1 Tax=Vagococcus lutrae TaxID=81947 RepID=UPI00288D3C4B|nr:DUF4041 domain-containing protein [Vagococcus lutrae]MDT2817437.1 DUF4041 domain-containing protein [Vagococcus lutrae]